MATTSGQSNFFLSNADVLLESFSRCEMPPESLTSEHMISARRSIGLEFIAWNSSIPLLWKIDATPTMIPLQQGVSVYNLPTDTVTMLDTYLRTFQLPNQFNVAPSFTTVAGSTNIQASIANNGMLPGYWFQITTPVAIGGIVLFGFYQITTIVSASVFNFTALTAATSSVVSGGVLPVFTTTAANTLVLVNLANHGYVAGQSFNIATQTQVGGIILLGTYTINSVPDSNSFYIQTNTQASFSASATENNGLMQIQAQALTSANIIAPGQPSGTDPIDRILTPIGRTDYAMFPDKFTQTTPSQYLFLRNVNPTVTTYQVPDGNGPYVLMTYLMRRIQNAGIGMGEIPDIHFLAQDALCARLAVRLAVKYAKPMLAVLKQEAKESWESFIVENREQGVENYVTPNLSGYWNITS